MIISIIAAMSSNNVIGRDGKIPWNSKEEMKFFKEKTMGKPIIMGRKTWDSLPKKPLPGRFNVVVTRNPDLIGLRGDENGADGPIFVDSVQMAVDCVDHLGLECFIIGGEQLYKDALDMGIVDRMYLNVMNFSVVGDTYFPYYDRKNWIVDSPESKVTEFKSYTLIRKNKEDDDV
jgi:dihydrofolate reductase